jgi:hypothetical protein
LLRTGTDRTRSCPPSTSDCEMVAAWNATVIRMIDRLFSDSGFVDYEDALSTVVPPDLIEERCKRLNQVERVGETGPK